MQRLYRAEGYIHSSDSSLPRVGLCFSTFRDSFNVGIRCVGGGAPITSRASDFTALVALNFFFFLRVAITAIAHFRNMGIMQ